MHDKYEYEFDARRIIEELGGVGPATEKFNEFGAAITKKAVHKMVSRNHITSDALATVLMASVKSGNPVLNVYDYILEKS